MGDDVTGDWIDLRRLAKPPRVLEREGCLLVAKMLREALGGDAWRDAKPRARPDPDTRHLPPTLADQAKATISARDAHPKARTKGEP